MIILKIICMVQFYTMKINTTWQRKNLDKINELTGRHIEYDIKYISSLVINGKLGEAAKIVSETERVYSDIFLFDFIKSVNLKQKKYEVALSEIKKIKSNDPAF